MSCTCAALLQVSPLLTKARGDQLARNPDIEAAADTTTSILICVSTKSTSKHLPPTSTVYNSSDDHNVDAHSNPAIADICAYLALQSALIVNSRRNNDEKNSQHRSHGGQLTTRDKTRRPLTVLIHIRRYACRVANRTKTYTDAQSVRG